MTLESTEGQVLLPRDGHYGFSAKGLWVTRWPNWGGLGGPLLVTKEGHFR